MHKSARQGLLTDDIGGARAGRLLPGQRGDWEKLINKYIKTGCFPYVRARPFKSRALVRSHTIFWPPVAAAIDPLFLTASNQTDRQIDRLGTVGFSDSGDILIYNFLINHRAGTVPAWLHNKCGRLTRSIWQTTSRAPREATNKP